MTSAGVGRWQLLASAVAGRLVDVAPGEAGGSAWTDGATICVAECAVDRDQLRSVTVQAALLGAGSLDADVTRALGRRTAVARRYLALEGHRALAEHDALLPMSVRALVDPRVVARTDSPGTSLAVSRSQDAVDDAPAFFGTIRPRQMHATTDRIAAGPPAAQEV